MRSDSMTKQAQQNLDYLIQNSSNFPYFYLICNFNKLIDPLINKVMIFINFYNTSQTSNDYIQKYWKMNLK